jgi:hypothetical protein
MKAEAPDARPDPRKDDLKPLWAIFWRLLILAPFLWILGLGLFVAIFVAFIAPPFYSVIAFISGDYLYGIAILIGWLVLLRFRKPMFRWAFDGIQYSGN